MVTTNSLPNGSASHTIVQQDQGKLQAKQLTPTPDVSTWSLPDALARAGLSPINTPPKSPMQFFHLIERLKTTPREGWRRFEIDGESISDHMYRMSIMTMLAPAPLASRLDLARCTRMALVHDMAESLVGDITPVDGVSKAEKARREAETIDYIADHLLGQVPAGGAQAGAMIRDIWLEYEADVTDEAHFVHDIDKLELLLQMVEYEKANADRALDLGEFTAVAKRVKMPEMKLWCAELVKERNDFWRAKGNTTVQGFDRGEEVINSVVNSSG